MRAARSAQKEMQVRLGEAAPAGRRIAPPKGCGRRDSYRPDRFLAESHRISFAQVGARAATQLLASHGGAKTTSSAVIVSKS